jgi:hypothetical protein
MKTRKCERIWDHKMKKRGKKKTRIISGISPCASLARWVMEFPFHGSLSPECVPFGKCTKSNRFRIYDVCPNYFLSENPWRVRFGWSMNREWLWHFSWTKEPIFAILQTDCRHILVNMLFNFERSNSGLQRHGSVVKISMMKYAPEHPLSMILMPQFWPY